MGQKIHPIGFRLKINRPWEARWFAEGRRYTENLHEDFKIILRFWDCPKPTLAAVHGYCLGSAMELAMACDITVSADDCRFGAPEVKFGSGIVAMLAPWLAGPKHAKYLLLSGDDRVTAQHFFKVRIWNQDTLIDELLANYDKLGEDLRAELPLKRIWAVASAEGEE